MQEFNEIMIYGICVFALFILAIRYYLRRRRQFTESRSTPTTVLGFFKESSYFNRLGDEDLKELASIVEGGGLKAGEFLFQEGAQEDSAFIIVRGDLDILKNINGQQTHLATIGEGQIVGEMALLSGEPRTATIRAKTNCMLLRISKKAFTKISKTNPRIRSKVLMSNAYRTLENCMRSLGMKVTDDFNGEKWMELALEIQLSKKAQSVPTGVKHLFLFAGKLQLEEQGFSSPKLIEVEKGQKITGEKGTTIYWMPPQIEQMIA